MVNYATFIVIVCVTRIANCELNIYNNNKTILHFTPEVTVTIHQASAACAQPGDDVADYHRIIREGRISEEPGFKAFITCLIRTNGYGDARGKFLVAKTAVLYPDPPLMEALLTRCNDAATGSDPVEVGFLAFKCYQTQSPYDLVF